MKTRQNLLSIIALLFIISGATGLMYQIVWFKYLSLFLGNTTYAQTVVLASFMGGLAIGATLWGKRADRTKNPLALYAWLELGIGVYCLAYPWLLEIVKSAFISIVISAGWASDSGIVLLFKLLVSLVTLLIPTMLMGGTLPVLVRFLSERIEDAGKNVAVLYFLNSFGAVVGSLMGGFLLVPTLGLQTTIFSAVGVNVFVGVVALVLSRMKFEQVEQAAVSSESSSQQYSDKHVKIAIIVAGLSGFSAMVYEVAWVRLLMPLLGSSTYSFTLMLVAFISGITLGSWIVSAIISRLKNLLGFLAVCQLGVVLSMIAALPLYGRVPYYLWSISSLLSRTEGAYPIFLVIEFLLCFAIMFVPTVFLGMSLPVASHIASRRIDLLGASVGNIFSVNTLGTVLGSLTAGLVLIPTVGIRHAIEIGVAINLVLGVLLLRADSVYLPKWKRVFSLMSVGLFAVYLFLGAGWNQHVMLMSIFRQIAFNAPPPASYADFVQEAMHKEILYYEEGASATVAVAQTSPRDRVNYSLFINGKVDASSANDMPTQVLLGQIPMLLHQEAKDALVIGLGSGVTVGSILTHPVVSVDCIEISPEVVKAVSFFEGVNNRPLDDPRTRVIIDDALTYLHLTEKKYDVIVSEPSNPWVAGVGNLFTREFFRQAQSRLTDNGLFVQWFHTYEMSDETFMLVLRTLREVFPHILLWQGLDHDMIMIASGRELSVDYPLLKETFEVPAIRSDLQRIDIPDAMTFLSMQILSEESLAYYAGAGEVNTEDLPRLEYRAPRDLFLRHRTTLLARYDERTRFGGMKLFLKKVIHEYGLTDQETLHIGKLHAQATRGNPALGHQMLLAYHQQHPKDIPALLSLVRVTDLFYREEEVLGYLKRITELAPKDPQALASYAWRNFLHKRAAAAALEPFDLTEEEALLKRSITLAGDTVDSFRIKLGEIYYRVQRFEEAKEEYLAVLQIREKYRPDPELGDDVLRLLLSQCYLMLGDNSKALEFAVQATMINPRNEAAREHVYQLWSKMTE